MSRARINGRHFSIMSAVSKGDHVVAASPEHIELEAWGYIAGEPTSQGVAYTMTDLGEKVLRTWNEMDKSNEPVS